MAKSRFGLLEWSLALTVGVFVLQVFPDFPRKLWASLDVRTWSLGVWLVVQALVLISLLVIRFGPTLAESWTTDSKSRDEKAAHEQQIRETQERRKMIQGIKDGRRRRIM